ncbi:hypothetical protein X947_4300 [Burkholderia pseudomallei MSHR7334]|nr:hypothetical protein X947_4300 [Burkholderia pseudomallei MSHR7334]
MAERLATAMRRACAIVDRSGAAAETTAEPAAPSRRGLRLPPRSCRVARPVEHRIGQRALVACRVIEAQHRLGDRVVHRLAFEKIVDLLVRDAVRVLVGPLRTQRFEIGGRRFQHERLVGAQHARECAHAAFREARERQHVRAAVAELREEAHHRFRRVIGADHDAVPRARHRVLRDHPLARLDVAEHEILLCVVEIRQAARRERGEHRIGGRLHVDRERLVRAHEGERAPCVRFVVLRAVRQPHRDEARVVARCAQPLDGQLREPARRRRIDAAADAQHAGPQSGRAQIIGDEPDAALGFVARIERGRHVQFGGDRTPAGGLIGTGHRVLLRGGIEEPIIGGFARACRRRIRLSIRSSDVGNRSPVSDN